MKPAWPHETKTNLDSPGYSTSVNKRKAIHPSQTSANIARRRMKAKSKPERRKQWSAQTARGSAPALAARGSCPVIAMAASEGGLKALSVILSGLPADFPAAIAIVMHLSPHHESILAEILDSRSDLEVRQAKTGDFLCRSCVFVAPPNHHLLVGKSGCLKLSSSSATKVNHARPSAEPLFVSVAKVYRSNAIAVVLTGGDGDGSFGVQIIKDEGGTVIAQDRPTSENFSMPETSIKTGDVDFILPLDEIGPKLIELVGAGQEPEHGRRTARAEIRSSKSEVRKKSEARNSKDAVCAKHSAEQFPSSSPKQVRPSDFGLLSDLGNSDLGFQAKRTAPKQALAKGLTTRYPAGTKAARVTRIN